MSKISLSIIGIYLLMVYFVSATADMVEAIATSTTSSPKGEPNSLQKIYPMLRNQKLSNNMLSLIHNFKREKTNHRRLRRIKRKGAFVVTDLEGNPVLVVRKQKIKHNYNYPKEPTVYDLQKLGMIPSGALPNFPVSSNMVPVPQLPYNLGNPNFGQPGYPSAVNMLPRPDTRNSLTDEYYDDFDLIPLSAIKSSRVKKKDASIITEGFSTKTTQSSATPASLSSATKSMKQIKQREIKNVDNTKGVVNIVSLLASALEQAFSVPHEVVVPNIKRESTSSISIGIPIPELSSSTLEQVKSEGISSNPLQDIVSPALEQIPLPSMDKFIRALINSSLDRNPVNIPISTTEVPILEQLFPFTTPFNVKRAEHVQYRTIPKEDWKDFRLRYAVSKLHEKASPEPRNVSPKDILSFPSIDISSPEPITAESKPTTQDINSFWQDNAKSNNNLNFHSSNLPRYKLENNEILGSNTVANDNSSSVHSSNTIERILEIVQDIQVHEKQGKLREDLPCNITGSWSSFAGGMLVAIDFCNNSLSMYVHPKTPSCKKGLLLEDGWEFKVFKPFLKNDVLIVNGLNEKAKKVVSFIGECRVCGGIESIAGHWLEGRPSANCKDQKASEELYSDVWTRETLTKRQKKKLRSVKEKTIRRAQEKELKKAVTCTACTP